MTATSMSSAADLLDLTKRPYSKRNIFSLSMTVLTTGLALMSIVVLFSILFFVLSKGLSAITFDSFFRLTPAPQSEQVLANLTSEQRGGFGNALMGTLIVVGIATAISFPLGVLSAIFLSEFGSGSKVAAGIRFGIKVLSGVPSIIAGIFAYGVIVVTLKTFSAISAGVALAVLMLPIIILSTEEALRLISQEVRAAALALGATKFQMISQVVLPAALPVIMTGTTLAVARACGETAPLIFTALFSSQWPDLRNLNQPTASLSVMIYNFAQVPFENQKVIAWSGALILVMIVLFTSIVFRLLIKPKI